MGGGVHPDTQRLFGKYTLISPDVDHRLITNVTHLLRFNSTFEGST